MNISGKGVECRRSIYKWQKGRYERTSGRGKRKRSPCDENVKERYVRMEEIRVQAVGPRVKMTREKDTRVEEVRKQEAKVVTREKMQGAQVIKL